MRDVRLFDDPEPLPPRQRPATGIFALAALGAVAVAIVGFVLNPFAGSASDALPASVEGLTFWSGGDSTSYYMSVALTEALTADGAIAVQSEPSYENGSGLLTPDYFDWRAHLREQVALSDPDIVVFMIGANDARDGFETDAYRAKVAEVMDELESDGRYVVWLGQPNMADPVRADLVRQMNDIFESEAAKRSGIRYVDTWEATSNASGGYTALAYKDGDEIAIRADDGLHFTPAGGTLLARLVLDALGQ